WLVEIVIPRAFSSGAASIASYALKSPKYLVIAAVSVVLPWSTWPIVPTFTCGFVRSNFAFAIHLPQGRRAHGTRATDWIPQVGCALRPIARKRNRQDGVAAQGDGADGQCDPLSCRAPAAAPCRSRRRHRGGSDVGHRGDAIRGADQGRHGRDPHS